MAAEATIQKRSIAYAKARGVEAIRLVFRAGVARGWPDTLFLIPGGRGLFIEFKAPGKQPSPMQHHRIAQLKAAGYDAAVCDSFDTAREAITRALDAATIHAAGRGLPRSESRGGAAAQAERA